MNKFQTLSLSVFSAALLILAFPQTNWWLLAWVGLVPLLLCLDKLSWKAAWAWSFVSAFIFFFGTLGWIKYVTYPGTILLMLYLALYVGFFALSYKFFTPLSLMPRVFARSASWVVLEFLRSYLFTGFGWSLIGHSQYQNLWMIQIADITGVYGVSFLIVLVNLVIGETILAVRKKIASRSLAMTLIVTAVLIISSIGYGLYQLNTHPNWPTVKIGVVQPNIPQSIKWQSEMRTLIVDKHIQLSNLLKDQQLDLIVWPETSLPGITEDSPDLVNSIRRTAVRNHTPIIFGAITQDKANYYNSALSFSRVGELGAQYNKIHLVPFGEFLPLRPILGWINNFVALEDFTSGTTYTLFDVGAYKSAAGVLICFEDSLSYLRRNLTNHGAKLWINMTNDAWFEDTKAPFMHLQAAVFGSVENKRALVRSANTGFSGFIDPFGRVIGAVANEKGKHTFVAGVAYADVPLVDQKTFYTKHADLFTFLCFLGILWAFTLLNIQRRKKHV